jgi:hypothetical protein
MHLSDGKPLVAACILLPAALPVAELHVPLNSNLVWAADDVFAENSAQKRGKRSNVLTPSIIRDFSKTFEIFKILGCR